MSKYKIVPAEPTPEMEGAHEVFGDTSDWWNAVIAVAPAPVAIAEDVERVAEALWLAQTLRLLRDAPEQARTVGEWFEWDFGAIQKVLASHHFYVTEPNLDEVFHKSCRYKAEEMEQLHDRGHPILVRIEPDPRAVHA